MNFKQLIRLYESKIVFQHPGEDEEKNRNKIYSLKQFENWFKKNKSNLIWNEQAQGYDSNTDIKILYLNLTIIPIQFNIVKGDFYCSLNYLISLEGCPKEVGGNFNCSENNLTSLKGCPKKIGKDLDCSFNHLTSLEGSPEEIGENFDCSFNKLISLKGSPEKVRGTFECYNNQLISLEGCPKKVGKNFGCWNNKVKFTEEQVRSVCKVGGRIVT